MPRTLHHAADGDVSSGIDAAARIVAQNIKRSLRAFRDEDHDGQDDHGEHGDDGGHH